MTETVCLVMPAATLAGPAGSRTTRRPALDRNRAAAWIAKAETRLRRIEAQARGRAVARGLASDGGIVARARFLVSESGGTLNVIEAVNRARDEAGLTKPQGPSDADIVAGARRMMADSGGMLNVIEAVDKARDEAATLAATGTNARESQAWERRREQHERVKETLADTAFALERRLMAHPRELIAAARRAMADDPLQARELAIRAREAMAAIGALYGKKPDHGPARRILQGAGVRTA